MDEKFGSIENSAKDSKNDLSGESSKSKTIDNAKENFRSFTMYKNGEIRSAAGGEAIADASKIFIILGWVSAAFTAFISPLFAIAGIVLGVITNRKWRGKGNVIIITNIVLAAVNILFGFFLIGFSMATMLRH